MSWLKRRRPQRALSGVDNRYLPQLFGRPFRFARRRRRPIVYESPTVLVDELSYAMPIPQTPDEMLRAGLTFIGKP